MLAVFLAGVGAVAQTDITKQPLYIYMYARVTDQVNIEISEDQVRHLVAAVEKYRSRRPEAHISATILFSGAVSDALAKRNNQTHIVDLVRGSIRKGLIEPGYDGADEPTYEHRPLLHFIDGGKPEDRWVSRHEIAEKLLTEARDPISGALIEGGSGGLKRMEEVFGSATSLTGLSLWSADLPAAQITGVEARRSSLVKDNRPSPVPALTAGLQPELGGDSEIVQALPHYTRTPLIFGVTDTNPWHLPGFRGARSGFSRFMSPVSNTAPELYWQDSVLRTSEASGDVIRLVHANLGIEPLKNLVGAADRSRIHVIHLEVASEQNYLQPPFAKGENYPPLKYAYSHPDNPKLPDQAVLPKADVDAAYLKEDDLLGWLNNEFLPSDHGSRFVSNDDLMHMVEPTSGFTISMDGLRTAFAEYLKQAGTDTYLPPLFRAEGHYLSMADVFQISTDALAEFHWNHKFPNSMKVVKVYGPVHFYTGHGVNEGEVSVSSIAKACADIDAALRDKSPSPIPKNAVPPSETVDGIQLNSAQFLRLMGQAILDPVPEKKLPVRMTYMITAPGEVLPKLRRMSDMGFLWTIKPAVFLPAKETPLAKK